jgi:hypothetical protein
MDSVVEEGVGVGVIVGSARVGSGVATVGVGVTVGVRVAGPPVVGVKVTFTVCVGEGVT